MQVLQVSRAQNRLFLVERGASMPRTAPIRSRTVTYGKPAKAALNPVGERRAESLTSICRELPPVVYFIRTDDGLIKIGHTSHLDTRKRKFGSGWDRILAVVPGTRDDEAAAHARFAHHLEHGREYFRPGDDLVEHINEIRRRLNVPEWSP